MKIKLNEDLFDEIVDVVSPIPTTTEEVPDLDTKGTLSVTEVDSKPLEGNDVGVLDLLNSAMQSELSAVSMYNSIIATLEVENKQDIIDILRDIVREENTHIGQLKKAMQLISGDAELIDVGSEEAEEQINAEPIVENKEDKTITENLNTTKKHNLAGLTFDNTSFYDDGSLNK